MDSLHKTNPAVNFEVLSTYDVCAAESKFPCSTYNQDFFWPIKPLHLLRGLESTIGRVVLHNYNLILQLTADRLFMKKFITVAITKLITSRKLSFLRRLLFTERFIQHWYNERQISLLIIRWQDDAVLHPRDEELTTDSNVSCFPAPSNYLNDSNRNPRPSRNA